MRCNSGGLLASIVLIACGTVAGAAQPIPVPNPGFENGDAGALPPGWHAGIDADGSKDVPAFRVIVDTEGPHTGRASARLESPTGPIAASDFGTITNAVDATAYRGRRVRLTGAVRAEPKDDGQVGLWLRVDRAGGLTGFFDNMGDRPITSSAWADYSIEGDVSPDATKLVFGLLLVGHGRAWLDDVRLEDIGPARGTGIVGGWGNRPRAAPAPGDAPPRPLSARGFVNLHAFARLYGLARFFHPSDESAAADWDSLALAGVARVENSTGPNELAAALREIFAPVAPSIEIYPTNRPPRAPTLIHPQGAVTAIRWHHVGFGNDPGHVYKSERVPADNVGRSDIYTVQLPGGITARVPLAVWRDAQGSTLPPATKPPLPTGKPPGFIPAGFDRTTRLAAVTAAWSMFGQFYPYFGDRRATWNSALDEALHSAATDKDDLAFRTTLRRLVARLHDGHAMVPYYEPPKGALPLAWNVVEGQLVVTAAGKGTGLKRGDVIVAIDGVPAAQAVARRAALWSGSPQWTQVRGLEDLLTGPPEASVVLSLKRASGAGKVTLRYAKAAAEPAVREAKPDAIAELSPGLFYVDIDRVTQSGFDARIPDLAKAQGLIFDLRGYPRMSPDFLRHFSDHPVKSGHFTSLAFDRPDRTGVPAADGQWTLEPLAPRFTKNVVFITNGSAISYSESVLSVVAGNHLADIVGSPSAGANGNITFFDLPGGYQVSWTGMLVTNLDGSRQNLVGIQPTVPVRRTLAGVRAGRDELLDRAVRLAKARMKSGN